MADHGFQYAVMKASTNAQCSKLEDEQQCKVITRSTLQVHSRGPVCMLGDGEHLLQRCVQVRDVSLSACKLK